MAQRLRAVFHEGHFIPTESCDIPDGAEVNLTVDVPHIVPPRVEDPESRRRIIAGMVERMHKNPLPVDAPRVTRDQLHERS